MSPISKIKWNVQLGGKRWTVEKLVKRFFWGVSDEFVTGLNGKSQKISCITFDLHGQAC